VLAEVGVEAAPADEDDDAAGSPDEQVAQFREFLDQASAEDFERGEPGEQGDQGRGSTSGGG